MSLSRRRVLAGITGLAATTLVTSRPARGAMMTTDRTFELRQYTLRAGQRETLVSIFERHFVEPQNDLGAHIVGSFTDVDDPDRFVWIRGFADMAARQRALEAFYGGPDWHAHRAEANATMIDSDNVLLLRPAQEGAAFAASAFPSDSASGIFGATIYYLASAEAEQFAAFFRRAVTPHLKELGVEPLTHLITEESPNNFPRLPVRQHERVFLWIARWPSLDSHDAYLSQFRRISGWRDEAPESVLPALMRKPEQLRLIPTARSELR
jgi:NIPSNAP